MSTDITKVESITRMLRELQAELGENAFVVEDHWDSDRCAIGIARPDDHGVLVYVSTYKCNSNEYRVSLELPPDNGNEVLYVPAGEQEVYGIQELAAVLRGRFGAKNV
jgi:hypothetical protein